MFLAELAGITARQPVTPNPDHTAEFVQGRIDEVLADGRVPPSTRWSAEWWSLVHHIPAELGPDETGTVDVSGFEDDSLEHRIEYEIVPLPTADPTDLESFRDAINELGAKGFDLVTTLSLGESGQGIGRTTVVILKRDSWAGG